MHRFPSYQSLRRVRISAFLLLVALLLAPVALMVLLWGFIAIDKNLLVTGWVLVVLAVLMVPIQWILAARANCPLCITPVMVSKGCSRHRNAKKLLGSYRLRVALSVLFTGSFRCPYCGEPTVLEVREGRR